MKSTTTGSPGEAGATLNRKGIRGIVVQTVLIPIGLAVLFISAGTLDWVNGWIYAGLVSFYWIISTTFLARVNPQVLNERGQLAGTGTKKFDKLYVALFPVLSFGSLVVMGFDALRFHWSSMPFWLTIVGVCLFVLASPLAVLAMAVNRFFEWTVRIQGDKGHYVCQDGPYRLIRHPGYAGLIGSLLAYPFILGSWWGFVPNGILSAVIVLRTFLEDRTLQAELPGYQEYAQKVKYRMIPFVW